ncbi:MAG: acyl--CoA ligase [Acidobacteria bacterium]|nr:acyl--CoA ligase [Acidobacteriota bacterium]
MLVNEILEKAAREFPDKAAVWFRGGWRTYAQIDREADCVAGYLISIGVKAGDRVAVLLENSFDYICAHFGIHRAGAVEVSLNTELKADEIKRLLDDCGAKVIFARTNSWPGVRQITMGEIPANMAVSVPRRIDVDLAAIVYTSGVTSSPKGVMLSHLNLVSNTRSIVEYLGLRSDDRMMVVLPFYYIYGRSLLYSHFMSGGSLVLDNSFAYPAKVLNTMRELEVTAFAGVPSTFSILLKKSDLKSRKFPSLRFVTQAGGGMAPAMQKEAVEAFHPARLYIMYGSTEAAPRLTYVEPEMLPKKWGSIGRAIPNVEVIVVDKSGNRCAPGIAGEIAARGSNIMMGYWKDPEATAQVMKNGYYLTGDLGYADEDGYIFLTGRSKDIIKAGGNRISAKEIEDAIDEIPGVLESAVIGVPDEILGEAIKAFIVPAKADLTKEQLIAQLSSRLPAFKVPKWFEFHESLPKNQSGKILKSKLSHELHELWNG